MKRIIVATKNKNKVIEIAKILPEYEIVTMEEAGIDIEIEEDGTTFEENALIKAKAVKEFVKDDIVIADDSGLCVTCLDGAPGIYSARYGGHELDYGIKNRMLIDEVNAKNTTDRSAKYVCSIACVDEEEHVFTGECHGEITKDPSGSNGFGYDPIFFVKEYNKTMAEISPKVKNEISHRAEALKMLKSYFKTK